MTCYRKALKNIVYVFLFMFIFFAKRYQKIQTKNSDEYRCMYFYSVIMYMYNIYNSNVYKMIV